MIDEQGLTSAIETLMRYKTELAAGRQMQAAGMTVPNTKSRDFLGVLNGGSRRVMAALDIRDQEMLECLGELCLNASRNMEMNAAERASGKPATMW